MRRHFENVLVENHSAQMEESISIAKGMYGKEKKDTEFAVS